MSIIDTSSGAVAAFYQKNFSNGLKSSLAPEETFQVPDTGKPEKLSQITERIKGLQQREAEQQSAGKSTRAAIVDLSPAAQHMLNSGSVTDNENDPRWIAADAKMNPNKGKGVIMTAENGAVVSKPHTMDEEELAKLGNLFVQDMDRRMEGLSNLVATQENAQPTTGSEISWNTHDLLYELNSLKHTMQSAGMESEIETYFTENSSRFFGKTVSLQSLFNRFGIT